jgi:hypothetical protein
MKKDQLLLMLALPVICSAQNNNAPLSYDLHDNIITMCLQTQFQKVQSPGMSSFSRNKPSSPIDNHSLSFKNYTNDLKDDVLKALSLSNGSWYSIS